jgi:hypothetical protein
MLEVYLLREKMMTRNNIMNWFEDCGHEIILSRSNKRKEIVGIVICDDEAKNTYRVTGKDELDVLVDLRHMLCGTYNKD